MNRLAQETLEQIAKSSGRCYPHEGKAMAEELLAFRHDEKLRAQSAVAAGTLTGMPGGLAGAPTPYHP